MIARFSITPEQDFKRTMSIMFTVLVGLVIIGFFGMAYIDYSVRRAIFSGEAGLQFVTLFSIVIAIILFGITKILEAKELAALLGGLSGYILGRYSSREQTKGGTTEAALFSRELKSIRITGSLGLDAAKSSEKLTATPLNERGDPLSASSAVFSPKWSSSDASVARVDADTGVVTQVGTGTCDITAEFDGIVSNTCTVTCS